MDTGKMVKLFVLIAIVLIGVSLAMPWFTYTQDGDNYESTQEFGLTELKMTSKLNGTSSDDTIAYDDSDFDADTVKSTFDATMYIAIGGLALNVIVLLFLLKGPSDILKILALLGAVLALVAPLYLMAALPGALDSDLEGDDKPGYTESFMGSEKTDTFFGEADTTWGPGIGWILCLVAGILSLLAALMVMKKFNEL